MEPREAGAGRRVLRSSPRFAYPALAGRARREVGCRAMVAIAARIGLVGRRSGGNEPGRWSVEAGTASTRAGAVSAWADPPIDRSAVRAGPAGTRSGSVRPTPASCSDSEMPCAWRAVGSTLRNALPGKIVTASGRTTVGVAAGLPRSAGSPFGFTRFPESSASVCRLVGRKGSADMIRSGPACPLGAALAPERRRPAPRGSAGLVAPRRLSGRGAGGRWASEDGTGRSAWRRRPSASGGRIGRL